jgi:hypothetical protein
MDATFLAQSSSKEAEHRDNFCTDEQAVEGWETMVLWED